MFSKPSRPKNPLIVGYTTRRHLLIDLDDTTFQKVRMLVFKIIRQWPEVGDCLILKSSQSNIDRQTRYTRNGVPYVVIKRPSFHLVFNNDIGFNKCCLICETLSGVGVLERDYEKIRTFRGDMTLRVSESELTSGIKPSPWGLEYIFNRYTERHDGLIHNYEAFYNAVDDMFRLKSIRESDLDSNKAA